MVPNLKHLAALASAVGLGTLVFNKWSTMTASWTASDWLALTGFLGLGCLWVTLQIAALRRRFYKSGLEAGRIRAHEEILERAAGETPSELIAVLMAAQRAGEFDRLQHSQLPQMVPQSLNYKRFADFKNLIRTMKREGFQLSDPCLIKLWENVLTSHDLHHL